MKKEKIRIRKATAKDFRQLRDLKREFFLFEAEKDHLTNKKWIYTGLPQDLGRNLRSAKKAYFVAEIGRKMIGYAGMQIETTPAWKIPKKRVHIFNLFIKEPHRNKKIGKKLMMRSIRWAKSKGINQLILYCYWWNVRAQKFYNGLGFRDYARIMARPR